MSNDKKIVIDQAVLDSYKDYMPNTMDAIRQVMEYHNEYKARIAKARIAMYRELGNKDE